MPVTRSSAPLPVASAGVKQNVGLTRSPFSTCTVKIRKTVAVDVDHDLHGQNRVRNTCLIGRANAEWHLT